MTTNTKEGREALIDKARKIWANVREGASEQDMANAERAFMRLVAKHNLDEEELRRAQAAPDEAVTVELSKVYGKYNESWRIACYSTAAKMFLCNYFFRTLRSGDKKILHNIVGEPHNVAVAVEMGAYFESTINRLANEGARINPDAKTSHTARHRYIRTFRLSAVERVRARVMEYLNDLKKGAVVDEESGTTLPALQSLYDRAQNLYQGWLEQNGITVQTVMPKDQRLSAAGKRDGREAGNKVSLTTQVGQASARFALPDG